MTTNFMMITKPQSFLLGRNSNQTELWVNTLYDSFYSTFLFFQILCSYQRFFYTSQKFE